MTDILQIFSGNPLSTYIGKKIEAATQPELESEDWGLNLEICDIINENDDDAKDAVRAIRKRLLQIEQDRNFTITNRTLTVLETCVSNCSRRFHILVMTKDFIQDLVKLIGPKNNPPIDLQERVLRLIERWAEAFRSQPELGGVVAVYNDLKAKGVTFPTRDPSSNVPIQTPQRSVPLQQPPPQSNTGPDRRSQVASHPPQPSGPLVLEGDGYNKISQDLGIVQTSIEMFNEIMGVLESKNDESDWGLAADLNSTCRQMKDRIVDLIERVANEDLTIELLRLNDDLNNIFVKYDRLVKNRSKSVVQPNSPQQQTGEGQTSSAGAAPAFARTQNAARTENELSLIDFNAEDSTTGGDLGPSKSDAKTADIDPFDTSQILAKTSKPTSSSSPPSNQQSLANEIGRLNLSSGAENQSQQSTVKKPISGLPEEISSVREQDFAEIENWLSTDSGRDLTSIARDMPSIEPISIPNSEFENFIANRALAGSQAPQSSSQTKDQTKPEPSV